MEEDADNAWGYSAHNANSQLGLIQTVSLEEKTVFLFVFFFFILLGCKYVFWIYITVFVLKLVNLFNAYILWFFILILFWLTGNKSRGMKTCCLSNVKHQHFIIFFNSCYSLHLRFAVSALGDDFFFGGGDVIFISLYLLICNILCFTVSCLIRCVVVTACEMILFREFPNHDKRQTQPQSHNTPFCPLPWKL